MSLIGITDVYLYSDGSAISETAKAFLDKNNIKYTTALFADRKQHPQVFAPLKTWFAPGKFNVSTFPFVIYTEIHDDITNPSSYPRAFVAGPNLASSNLPDLWKLNNK